MSASARRDNTSPKRRLGTIFITAVTLIATVAIALTACSSGEARLGEDDSGDSVTIPVGGTIEVALDSNPSTGYVWLVSAVDPSIVVQAGESSYEPESDAVGAAGIETFYFEGVGAGSTPLVLEYSRPAELDSVERTFEIEVTVE